MSGIKSQVLTITMTMVKSSPTMNWWLKLETDIYFAHPYASWERGINENTNGLIRQYFPKGMDLRDVTMEQAQYVMDRLNNRPRSSRGGKRLMNYLRAASWFTCMIKSSQIITWNRETKKGLDFFCPIFYNEFLVNTI